MANKFKVGNIVRGNEIADHRYTLTTSDRLLEVMSVYNKRISAKIIGEFNMQGIPVLFERTRGPFDVAAEAFDLVAPSILSIADIQKFADSLESIRRLDTEMKRLIGGA